MGKVANGCFAVLMAINVNVNASVNPSNSLLTSNDFDKLMTEISNWGRWGKEDEIGTINLITSAKRVQAAAMIQKGISVSLAHLPDTQDAVDNPNPYKHTMLKSGMDNDSVAMDNLNVSFHGLAHTHLDSLCHIFYQGKMYNGYDQKLVSQKGCLKNDVSKLSVGIQTRAVLYDIAELKGKPYLSSDTIIYAEDLEAWEKAKGIKVGAGDVLLVRTGRWAKRQSEGAWDVKQQSSGLHPSVARWLKARDVAILGSDGLNDATPSVVEANMFPLHTLTIVGLGMSLLDNCDLEAVSKISKDAQRWEFAITVAPLAVPGGTGSPVNPIATF